MILKFFDDFDGIWKDVSGNTGSTLQKTATGWDTSQGYVYLSLLLSQDGTNDPDVVELDNTIGEAYAVERGGAGNYRVNFTNAVLSQGKTMVFIQQSDSAIIQAFRETGNIVRIYTSGDDILFFTSLEIRLYN
jgi:hypothetical protein